MLKQIFTGAILALTLLISSSQAKDIFIPHWADKTEARSRTQFPLGIHRIKYQQVLDAVSFYVKSASFVRKISFRADGQSTNIGHSITADFELKICTTKSSSVNLSTTFAHNRGPDLTTVIDRKMLKIEGFAAPLVKPAPFTIHLLLKKPFLLKPGSNLLLETTIWSNSGGKWNNWDFPCWMDAVDQGAVSPKYFGMSCPGTAGWPAVTGREAQIGHEIRVELWSAPKGANTLCIFGFSKSHFGPVKLPFSLTPLGASGCYLHVEPFAMLPFQVQAPNNLAIARMPLPEDIHLAGLDMYGQFLVMDPGANPAGLTTSGALQVTLKKPAHTGFVWANDPTAKSGVTSYLKAPVTRLTL